MAGPNWLKVVYRIKAQIVVYIELMWSIFVRLDHCNKQLWFLSNSRVAELPGWPKFLTATAWYQSVYSGLPGAR